MTPAGFPHSDTPGSTLGCQLPRAYRRLLRPSSALDAKASTMCPSQLVTHTTNPTHPPRPATNTKKTPPTTPNREPQAKPSPVSKPTTKDESDVAVHTTHYKDARVHYPDLKQQPHTNPQTRITRDQAPAGFLVPKPQMIPPRSFTRRRTPDSSEPQQCAPTHQQPARPAHRPTNQPPVHHQGARAGECR